MPAAKQPVARRAKNTPSNGDLLISFERHLKAENKSAQTRNHYLGASQHFLNYCQEENLPEAVNVTREHVELWLASLYEDYAVASVRNRFVGLHQFFKWLQEEGEITRDPMERIKRPVLEETRKDVVPPQSMAKVFAYLEKDKRWRDCMVVAILYDNGMRETELAETLVANVSLDAGTIFIPKTKNKQQRTVPISPKTVRYIDRYYRLRRRHPEYLVNGQFGRMTANGIYQLVRGLFEEVGFPARIGPHDLRHTAATTLALNGMDEAKLMQIMGWKDAKMARHYTAQVQQKIAIDSYRALSPMENLPVKRRQ
jgi:site-specific recombinase XerD